MKKLLFLLLFADILLSQYYPNYNNTIKQSMLELKNKAVVVNLLFKPGDEDIELLYNLKKYKGFKVFNLFVTRGEFEISKDGSLYDEKLGASLSETADHISKLLGIDNSYLNIIISNLSIERGNILKSMGGSTLIKNRIITALGLLKPDIILLPYAESDQIWSEYRKLVNESVIEAVKEMNSKTNSWKIQKIYSWTNRKDYGISLDIPKKQQTIELAKIRKHCEEKYQSLLIRRKNIPHVNNKFQLIYPLNNNLLNDKDLLTGLRYQFPNAEALLGVIDNLTQQDTLKKNKFLDLVQKADRIVDAFKTTYPNIEPIGERILNQFKHNLSEIRFNLLDVKIEKYLSDSAVCQRQLVKLTIDTIKNLKKGITKIIYYNIDDTNWVIMRGNDIGKTYKIKMREPFLFVTPDNIKLNYPRYKYQYDFLYELPFLEYIIVHEAENPLYSFQYFGREYIRMVQKADFSITPEYKYIWDKALFKFHLTHYLNDPFKNIMPKLVPEDSYKGTFRANKFNVFKKYDHLDGKLEFDINDSIPEGSYPITFTLGAPIFASATIKKFNLKSDSLLRIGLFSQSEEVFKEYFTALGINFELNPNIIEYGKFGSIIVDENFFNENNFEKIYPLLINHVRKGGNLVILSQHYFCDSISSEQIVRQKQKIISLIDHNIISVTQHKVLNTPNKINTDDFKSWVMEYGRYAPKIMNKDYENILSVLEGTTNIPLLSEFRIGKGTIFYIPMSMKRQMYYVIPSAYKLITNILHYKNEKD